jgi:diphthamide biosynthesis enzyme Dph1/Dph2-like protein
MSDVLYIEARRKFDLYKMDFSILDSLPEGDVSLAASVQYLDLLDEVKEYLEKMGRLVKVKKGAYYVGHVLGCNSSAFDSEADVLLLLCDGKFHAMNSAILLDSEIFVFNGYNLEKVYREEIDKYFMRLEAKKKKFLISERVGLLVSTKFGQNLKNVEAVRKKIEEMGKRVYVFESDNIMIGEFENYSDIGIFVNTACFGLARDDKKIVNLQDVLEYMK